MIFATQLSPSIAASITTIWAATTYRFDRLSGHKQLWRSHGSQTDQAATWLPPDGSGGR